MSVSEKKLLQFAEYILLSDEIREETGNDYFVENEWEIILNEAESIKENINEEYETTLD